MKAAAHALSAPRPVEVALLASVFVVAACGLVYELAAGALASYVLGDSVLQFSTIIGSYLFAMGIGSWLSRFFERQLPAHFLRIELMVALVGGLMPALLFLAEAYGAVWLALGPMARDLFDPKADLSYGIYLYGWPIQQSLHALWPDPSGLALLAPALALTLPVAALSWYGIERPALALVVAAMALGIAIIVAAAIHG